MSKDASKACQAAKTLVQHLATLTPETRTPFEHSLQGDEQLMMELRSFATQEAPCCLWKQGGQWAHLYKFLAVRFLANPDNVMDVERLHALWKWVLLRRRSLKLKSMNAWLKLGSYLHHNGAIPPMTELAPYIREIKGRYRQALEDVKFQDIIAPGQ